MANVRWKVVKKRPTSLSRNQVFLPFKSSGRPKPISSESQKPAPGTPEQRAV